MLPTVRDLCRTAAFAAVYAAAAVAGRATIIDQHSLSLVWPAAGVAVVWFAAVRGATGRGPGWWDVAALAAATWAVNALTDSGPVLAAAFVAANLVQLGVVLVVGRRLLPRLWGFGGTEAPVRVADVWGLLLAALAGTTAGALVGPTALWAVTGSWSWLTTAVWFGRNTASILVITTLGLLVAAQVRAVRERHAARGGRAEPSGRSAPLGRRLELAAMGVVSPAAYLAVFTDDSRMPLAFLMIALTAWVGSRTTPTWTAAHDAVMGCVAIVCTLRGGGPFAAIESEPVRALVAQVFVGLVALVGLSLSTARAERDQAVAGLRAARDKATEQSALLRTVLATMDEGVALVDADGRFLVRNAAAGRLMAGRASADGRLADPAAYGLLTADGEPMTAEAMPAHRALRGEHVDEDVHLRLDSGTDRVLAVRSTPLTTADGHRRALTVFADVSADRARRSELAAFAGVVAHDLQNPLTVIEGWSEMVAETMTALQREIPRELLAELLDPEARDRLLSHRATVVDGTARVQRSAARMRRLIRDLLAHTTASDAPLDLRPLDLTSVVSAVVDDQLQAVPDGAPQPVFHLGPLHDVEADAVLVRQLLENLVGNAIKYTAPGDVPEVTVASWTTGDGRAHVVVADRGIGIPPGHHERVFDDFHRAHPDAAQDGTGLGLSICRRVVQRHDGTITATENPGGGTRITFDLPGAQPARGVSTTVPVLAAAPS